MGKIAIFATAAFAMQIGSAYAIDYPPMKEGLWQIRTQTIDNPGNRKSEVTIVVCRDHAFDRKGEALARTIKGCSPSTESFANGRFSSEMTCKIGSTIIATKGIATFHGDTSAHSETHVIYTPAFAGSTDETMIQDQAYQGNCPPGMRPGDTRPH
jgi:Protein of unknown function (DUF3617)